LFLIVFVLTVSAAWGAGAADTVNAGPTQPDFAGFNLYGCGDGGGAPVRVNGNPVAEGSFYWKEERPGDVFCVRGVDTPGNESGGRASAAHLHEDLHEEVLNFVDPSNNRDPRVSYSGYWKSEAYSPAYGGQLVVCGAGGDAVEVTFYGRSAKLFCARYWQCGWCKVFLDGRSMGLVNLHAKNTEYDYPAFSICFLRPGLHTLKLVNLGIPGEVGFPIDFINVDYLVLR
jgi:hypothetical protein